MRIAQVAPLYERVPPVYYGGTERVVGHLTEELVRRGHAVTLFASSDSRTRAKLVAPAGRALRHATGVQDPIAPHALELLEVFEHAAAFDLIHCHVGYLAFPFARLARARTLHTLHGRLDTAELGPLFRRFPELPLVSISDAQRTPLRHLGLNWAATIRHGLPLEEYAVSSGQGGYLAFLGRISPEKRPDRAIAVAKRVGLPLKIAAKVDPVDRIYFERDIRPLLDHPLVEFVGEIGGHEKIRFLGDAVALLFPVDWPEPFGLVMIEAMACGTPVIACRRGSVEEILIDGNTGFIVDDVDGLVAAVGKISAIDRARCRRHVEKHFSVARMVDDYEAAYHRILASARAA